MKPLTLLLSVASSLLLATPFHGQIHVPGDYPDPQSAIDNAQSGDVILVHGGTWGGVTVDKSLTIVGDPRPTILGKPGAGAAWASPIRLAGPGSGAVTFANLDLGGTVSGVTYGSTDAGISGGGFDRLEVYDSVVQGPTWVNLTGSAFGAHGIDVTVPLVVVERSTVAASKSDIDIETYAGPDGVDALICAQTLVLLDSSVTGGTAGPYFLPFPDCSGCPCGGDGGRAIVCSVVYQSGSTVLGGAGADWYTKFAAAYCGSAPDGAAYAVGSFTLLPGDLEGSGPMTLGATYRLHLYSPAPSAFLFAGLGGYDDPIPLTPSGFLFTNTKAGFLNVGPVPCPGTWETTIPDLPVLAGMEVVFQTLHGGLQALSRPVGGVLTP